METPKRINKGLHLDSNPLDQPEGTYRFALNTVNESQEGDLGFLANEQSNSECGQLPEGFTAIGYVTIRDNRTVVFSTNNAESRIGIHDSNKCEYTDVVVTDCLMFNTEHPIQATYRVRNGCEDVIYFTDGQNPVRHFNFDRQENFKTDDAWNCSLFNLFLPNNIPCFQEIEIENRGELLSGTHNFAIQYLDEDLNPTHWIYSSQTVPVYKEIDTLPYNEIQGSSNYETDSLGGYGFPTNKSILLTLSNLDTNYRYYRLARIEAVSFNGLPTRAYKSNPIPLSQTTVSVDGRNNGWQEIPVEEILIKPERINSAEHIEQVENRLLLANTKGKPVNFCEFQQYASKIGSAYTAKPFDLSDVTSDGNGKNPNTYFGNMSFMADEVYAFGIVYVFADGTESPAFHIPGRPKDYSSQGVPSPGLDSTVLSTWNPEIAHIVPESDEATYNALPSNEKVQKWEYDNTASPTGGDFTDPNEDNTGHMAYWEARNSTYLDLLDCNGSGYWGNDYNNNPLVNQPIRHHKFPSRDIITHITPYATGTDGSTVIGNKKYSIVLTLDSTCNVDMPTSFTLDYIYFRNGVQQSGSVTISTSIAQIDLCPNVNRRSLTRELVPETEDVLTGYQMTGGTLFNYVDPADPANQVWEDNTTVTEVNEQTVYSARDIEGAGVLLGVQFYNIEYPHSDIVGHYFVTAERTDINKTVLSKGIMGKCREDKPAGSPFNYITFSHFTRNNNLESDDNYWLMYPEYQYENKPLKPTYIRHIGRIHAKNANYQAAKYDRRIPGLLNNIDIEIVARMQPYKAILEQSLTRRNYLFEKGMIMSGSSYNDNYDTDVDDTRVYNLSLTNKIAICTLNGDIEPDGDKLNYVALKRDIDVYTNIFDLSYIRMHNCMHALDDYETNEFGSKFSSQIYGGDTFIAKTNYANTSFREQHKDSFDDIVLGIGIVAAAAATILTAGAAGAGLAGLLTAVGVTSSTTLAGTITGSLVVGAYLTAGIGVTAIGVTQIVEAINNHGLDKMSNETGLDNAYYSVQSFIAYGCEILKDVVLESTINLSLRASHLAYGEGTIFKNSDDMLVYFRDKILYYDEEQTDNYEARITPIPEVYHYNKDYSRLNKESVYFPIPQTYNCCSECLEEFPNRIWWSKQSFQEENVDNYRIFLSNDYLDMESELGFINALVRKDTSLYAFTTKGVWKLLQNIQERMTGDLVTFVGTGEYLSLPPRSILDTDVDNIGTKSKWAILKIPSGIAFINDLGRNVYIVSEGQGIQEISRVGLKNWFEDNLVLELTNGLEDYPYYNSVQHEYGVGYISTYDSEHKRMILTKKDYIPKNVTFNGVDWVDGNTKVSFDDTNYFTNNSWTISYSFLTNTWTSWHSYLPNFYFPADRDFVSMIDNKFWKHNTKNNYQTYYGEQKPHILEIVFNTNPLQDSKWDAIKFHTQAQKYNPLYNEVNEERYITFNNAILYNHRQCSGELDLVSKDTQANPENYLSQQTVNEVGKVLLNKDEGNWTFNDFRDYRVDYTIPVWDKSKDNLSPYYIDKVLNSSSIDFNKNWYELETISGKYLILRLEFSTFSDVELITKYVISESTPSFR